MIFTKLVMKIKEQGYLFLEDYFSEQECFLLEKEAQGLTLEFGDHLTYPIWAGTKKEVRQLHSRIYLPIGDSQIPVATNLCHWMAGLAQDIPELNQWLMNEVGYQLYRQNLDFISPHRDRRNDQYLSLTITIKGSAWVKCYEPIDDPNDYQNLKLTDQFLTKPGTAMFLRAPGLGNNQQIIHEVLPPQDEDRLIVNLRMRSDILPNPTEFYRRRHDQN